MNLKGVVLLLIIGLVTAEEQSEETTTDAPATTVATEVSKNEPSSVTSRLKLDDKLRSALLKALADLENEEDQSDEEEEKTVEKASATAITIFANDDEIPTSLSSDEKKSEVSEPEQTTATSENRSKLQAASVLFQPSRAVQEHSLVTVETNPLDPVKDVEQIITSASNSFITKNGDFEPAQPSQTSSTSRESGIESEQKGFQFNAKVLGFGNINSISSSESRKPSKATIVEKFSIGKAVDEPDFIKTYVRPVGLSEKTINVEEVKSSVSSEANGIDNPNKEEHVTEAVPEISTEENEAKVEQVQFFSAPLVAAFTVHQDEQGQPKKVEPIYKNGISSKKQEPRPAIPNPVGNIQTASANILQSSTFNKLDLQQKQQILEQELEKLRTQQQNLLARNFASSSPQQSFNSLETANQAFTQTGFNQAINQNFNQFDPVFTEPDRSVVTKLATIDPSTLLAQKPSPLLNRFMPNEAILPITNSKIKSETKAPGDVSLVPSISFDPLVEAGKLPLNAQILPNKPPTGFHSFVKFAKPQVSQLQQQNLISSSSSNNNFAQTNNNNVFQASQNFIQPANQFNNNNNRFGGFSNQITNSNRFFRQEQGTINPGLGNQNSFSIEPAQQPFAPKHELSYFPDNSNFLRPQQQTNKFNRNQNQNRFFRSNLEGSVLNNIQIQPSIQPFGVQPLSSVSRLNLPQNTRILRSNPESTYQSNQIGFLPQAQNYRYTSSFGFPTIPLN